QLAPGEPGLALLVSCAGDHEQLPGRAELEEQGLLQRHRALLGGQIVLQPLQDRAAVGDVLACPVSSAETVGGDQDTAESSEAQPREPAITAAAAAISTTVRVRWAPLGGLVAEGSTGGEVVMASP